jgi:hypothetical protein
MIFTCTPPFCQFLVIRAVLVDIIDEISPINAPQAREKEPASGLSLLITPDK